MTERLKDLRIKSLEDAKQMMAKIARIATTIELHKARANSKISTIKDGLQEKISPLESELDGYGALLSAFIKANTGLFKKPRKVKCESGSFGLQTASGIVIANEEELIDYCRSNGLWDCVELVPKPVKKAIETRLNAGESLPGVTLSKGDTVVYKVDPKLIKEAKEG